MITNIFLDCILLIALCYIIHVNAKLNKILYALRIEEPKRPKILGVTLPLPIPSFKPVETVELEPEGERGAFSLVKLFLPTHNFE